MTKGVHETIANSLFITNTVHIGSKQRLGIDTILITIPVSDVSWLKSPSRK
jgi:hypothetical protein